MLSDQEQARLKTYVDAVTNQHRQWVYVAGAGYRRDPANGDPVGLHMAGTYFSALDFLAWRKETGVAATGAEMIRLCGFAVTCTRQLTTPCRNRYVTTGEPEGLDEAMMPVRKVGRAQVFEITDFGELLVRYTAENARELTSFRYVMNVEARRAYKITGDV